MAMAPTPDRWSRARRLMRTPRSRRTASGSCLHQPAKGRPICLCPAGRLRTRALDRLSGVRRPGCVLSRRPCDCLRVESQRPGRYLGARTRDTASGERDQPSSRRLPSSLGTRRALDCVLLGSRSPRSVRGAPGGLMFVAQQSTDIYVAHLDGSPDGKSLRRITHGDAVAGTPSWSRDGSSVVFYEADLKQQLQRGLGTTQIVWVAVATGERRVLTSGEGIKLFPQSLENGAISYVARRTGDQSYAQNSSGVVSQQVRIVLTSGVEGASGAFDSPHWSRRAAALHPLQRSRSGGAEDHPSNRSVR
jgi:hypothetical protein